MFKSQTPKPALAPIALRPKLMPYTPLQTFQAGHGWTKITGGGTFVDDVADFIVGTQSVKVTTDNNANTVIVQDTGLPAIDLTAQFLVIAIKVGTSNIASGLITLDIGDDAFANFFRWNLTRATGFLRAGIWNYQTLSFGEAAQTGAPTRNSLTAMRLRCTGNGTSYDVNLNLVGAYPEPSVGVVTFTFDDGWLSTYTKARQRLSLYGFKGVVYCVPRNIAEVAGSFMSKSQMQELQNLHGWQVSGQTNQRLDTLSGAAAVESEIRLLKSFLLDNNISVGVDHHAFQNGGYNDTVVMPLTYKYFRTNRTINEFAETIPPSDPLRLRILNITEQDVFANVQAKITQARTNKEWLIFLFHNIVDVVTDPTTQTSTALFNQIVDEVATQKALAPSLDVMTINDVVKSLP